MERIELNKAILSNIDTTSGCVHCNPIKMALDIPQTISHETQGRKDKHGKLTKGKVWREYIPNQRLKDSISEIRGAKGGARAYVETQLID